MKRTLVWITPALALCLGAGYYLLRYERTGRRRHLLLLAALIVLGIYAKQLAAFLVPLAVIEHNGELWVIV